jgi:hypothetical protein
MQLTLHSYLKIGKPLFTKSLSLRHHAAHVGLSGVRRTARRGCRSASGIVIFCYLYYLKNFTL